MDMGRTILHCYMNNFNASVKCMLNPFPRGHPVTVGGDVENRHGIILAKNYEEVIVRINENSTKRPLTVKFQGLKLYEIDKLKQITDRKASKVGGTGKCYWVVILGTETFLYEEDKGRWFVEAKENVGY